MSIFPSLQYGMDVNPKFTKGVTGVEYTSNLTAFELLNVDLVHGWLLDPHGDAETAEIVGPKAYNELIEEVIRGNDASSEVEKLSVDVEKLVAKLNGEEWTESKLTNEPAPSQAPSASVTDKFLASLTSPPVKEEEEKKDSPLIDMNFDTGSLYPSLDEVKTSLRDVSCDPTTVPTEDKQQLSPEEMAKIQQEIVDLKKKISDLSETATNGSLVNSFLQGTAHQLTQFGLQELYSYVKDDTMCVFFRNNHFSTLTKHEGVLYNLVTDLGYASVPQVVWEKLDVIDGDTEFMDSSFKKPSPQKAMVASSALAGEQLIARRGQTEADLQLAIQLSKQDGGAPPTGAKAHEVEEERLMKAALEESLNMNQSASQFPATTVTLPGTTAQPADLLDAKPSGIQAANAAASAAPVTDKLLAITGAPSPAPTSTTVLARPRPPNLMEDQDALIARQMQAEMQQADGDRASEALVQKLYAEETKRLDQAQTTSGRRGGKSNGSRKKSGESDNCTIS
uniref:MINDY deubiquitinase domain-containing protein n=1 Tax=Grammatophora oceanica TaxID=210454 RepID=A0A7S1UWV6_9STRA